MENINFLEFYEILETVNKPARTDRTASYKINRIKSYLDEDLSKYRLNEKISKDNYFYWFEHIDIDVSQPITIISSHLDNVFNVTFERICPSNIEGEEHRELLGTFDNSINNTILIYMACAKLLDKNTVIVFTDREEIGLHGAYSLGDRLSKFPNNYKYEIEKIITLDVTTPLRHTDKYTSIDVHSGVTIENFNDEAMSYFSNNEFFGLDMRRYISKSLPDESYAYMKFNHKKIKPFKNTPIFSLCSIVYPDPDILYRSFYMHSEQGCRIKWQTIKDTMEILFTMA